MRECLQSLGDFFDNVAHHKNKKEIDKTLELLKSWLEIDPAEADYHELLDCISHRKEGVKCLEYTLNIYKQGKAETNASFKDFLEIADENCTDAQFNNKTADLQKLFKQYKAMKELKREEIQQTYSQFIKIAKKYQHDIQFLKTTLKQLQQWKPKNIDKTYEELLEISTKYASKGKFDESLFLFQIWRTGVSPDGSFDAFL